MNLVALWGLTQEPIHYFETQAIASGGSLNSTDVINGTQMTITGLWTVYAFGLLVVGTWRKSYLAGCGKTIL